jgi:hypothetical protein
MNGVESETAKVMSEVNKLAKKPASPSTEDTTPDPTIKEEAIDDDDDDDEEDSSNGAGATSEETPAKSTRSKTKSGKKGTKT